MATTDDGRWYYKTGSHGATVRVREHPEPGKNVYLFWWDPDLGGNRKESLGFKVRGEDGKLIQKHVEKAKAEAATKSNNLILGEAEDPEDQEPDRTVGRIFDEFRRDGISDDLSDKHERELRRGLTCWENFLGRAFHLPDFDRSWWNTFQRKRCSGEINAYGRRVEKGRREVSKRTAGKDLKTLRQVCQFALHTKDAETGRNLLNSDPTKVGEQIPVNGDPNRPVCSDALLAKMLEKAENVTRRVRGDGENEKMRTCLPELLQVVAGTGRRIGAVLALRWSDWAPNAGQHGALTWRGEHQKNGDTHSTAVSPSVREALLEHRQRSPGGGEGWIFSAPDSDGHLRVDVALKWLQEAEKAARGHHVKGFGWHALRRRWANKMKDRSPVDAAALGGWKTVDTMQAVYQRSTPEDQDSILAAGDPGRVEAAEEGGS